MVIICMKSYSRRRFASMVSLGYFLLRSANVTASFASSLTQLTGGHLSGHGRLGSRRLTPGSNLE